jgi:PPOX class probable F420-dependent enzyme
MDFDDPTRALLDGKNFAVVATLLPDGRPQTSVIWFKRDGDTVLFTTTDRRQKARNLQRDPRVRLTVFDPNDPYRTVEIMPDPERHLSRELTNRYLGTEPPPDHEGESRLIVRVRPEKVVVFSA